MSSNRGTVLDLSQGTLRSGFSDWCMYRHMGDHATDARRYTRLSPLSASRNPYRCGSVQLADSKMDVMQNQRLGALQTTGKATGLSVAERYELLALLQIYQLGQLRQAAALAEAVRRGLRPPLPA